MRSIPGFPDYSIAENGAIWSAKRSGRWLKPYVNIDGYARVTLSVDGKAHTRLVHALILAAYVGPRPEGLEACHNDGDPANNHVSNLRWDTHASNMRDKIRHGTATSHNASKTHCPQGHPYDEQNTRTYSGHRICKTCNIESSRQRYADRVGRKVPRSGGGLEGW